MLQKLLALDEDLGYKVHHHAQYEAKHVKLFADLISISGDEVIWFGLPAVLGSILFLMRGLGAFRPMGCLEEGMWDCFGAASVCIFFETACKVRGGLLGLVESVPVRSADA